MKGRACILSFVMLLSAVGLLRAQSTFEKELALGISAGPTFSTVNFTPKVYQSMKMGFMGGATLRWITDKHVGVIVELNYAQYGWEEDFSEYNYQSGEGPYEFSRTLNYIELPFLTHAYIGNGNVRFFLNLGPKIGYMISESADSNLNGAKPSGRTNDHHDLAIKNKFSWGLCGGPGIEIRSGIGHFMLEGRFFYALGDLFGSTKADAFNKSSEQVLSAKLTYFLPILGK